MSSLFIFCRFPSKIESKIENINLGGLGLKITAGTNPAQRVPTSHKEITHTEVVVAILHLGTVQGHTNRQINLEIMQDRMSPPQASFVRLGDSVEFIPGSNQ